MPVMHLMQAGFIHSACAPLTENRERVQKFMQTGNTNYSNQNDLDTVYFQYDMVYGKYRFD